MLKIKKLISRRYLGFQSFGIIFFSFLVNISLSQNFKINFLGTGASLIVDSVEVKNLTQNKSIILSGNEVLHLGSNVTSANSNLSDIKNKLKVYPNPFSDFCIIEFGVSHSQMAKFSLFDLVGRNIIKNTMVLPVGLNSFKITGLPTGVYAVLIELSDKIYSGKLISNANREFTSFKMEYGGEIVESKPKIKDKKSNNEKYWQYNEGDRLLFKGVSGKYRTIVVEIPTKDTTILFNFIECTDGDGNNYPIVRIGNQIWMAQNLKTTVYNDESSIPNIKDNSTWNDLESGAFCFYDNDISKKDIYGALYNWYAVNTQNLAPKGWHVPTDEEWTILTDYLGGTEISGGKLKESGLINWLSPNKGATNETGFTGLPAGFRNTSGKFESLKHITSIWSSSIYPYWNAALDRVLASDISSVYIGNPPNRKEGKSVRCLYNISAPSIQTKKVVSVNATNSEIECEIINNTGGQIFEKGVCWSKSPNPDIFDYKIISKSEGNIFHCILNELQEGINYYVKAYAINSAGISYGEQITFKTLDYPLSGIKIVESDFIINPWQELQLEAIVFDEKGNTFQTQNCKWFSNNESIASINNDGKIIGNQIGRAKIYAKTDLFIDSVEVNVNIENDHLISEIIYLDSVGSWAETSIAINPKNSLNLVASANWANFFSNNGGRSWKKTSGNDYFSVDPNVGFLEDGTMLRQGLLEDSISRGILVQRSFDGGLSFLKENSVWAYKPQKDKGAADQGIMCIDTSSTSPYSGSVYVVTSDYPKETPNYNQIGFSLIVLISRDGGKTWLEPIDISTTDGGQEHSSYITTGINGEIYAAWWNLKEQIIFSKSIDGGITWNQEKVIHRTNKVNNYELSDDVRGNVTIKVDQGNSAYRGNIYLSAVDYNGISGGATDAWIMHSSDKGNSWSDEVLLSDGPRGIYKYYFQPRISVAPNGRVDAVWYDTRNWTGTNTNKMDYDLYYSYSTDGGQSFEKNIRITNNFSTKQTSCPTNNGCGQRILYEYIGLTSDNNRVMPVWTTIINGRATPAFSTIWIK